MIGIVFVTEHVSPTDMTQVRQDWLINHRRMFGETGEQYRVYGAVTVVSNPPEAPSVEAKRVIDSLE